MSTETTTCNTCHETAPTDAWRATHREECLASPDPEVRGMADERAVDWLVCPTCSLINRRRSLVAIVDYWAKEAWQVRYQAEPTDAERAQARIDLAAFDAAHPEILARLEAERAASKA